MRNTRCTRIRTGGGLLAILFLVIAAPAGAGELDAGAQEPAEAIALLNEYREAHGLPSRVIEYPPATAGCRAHNRYMQENGIVAHPESETMPFYSPIGDRAGRSAVLHSWSMKWKRQAVTFWGPGGLGSEDTDAGGPWAEAPYHQWQVLNPLLAATGWSNSHDRTCMVTLSGPWRADAEWKAEVEPHIAAHPVPDGIYVYPGDNAVADSTITHSCGELPTNPAEDVGYDCSETGLNLLVWRVSAATSGGDAGHVSATLTGPRGPVEVRVTRRVVVPKRALDPDATYHATATWPDGATRAWSFSPDSPRVPLRAA